MPRSPLYASLCTMLVLSLCLSGCEKPSPTTDNTQNNAPSLASAPSLSPEHTQAMFDAGTAALNQAQASAAALQKAVTGLLQTPTEQALKTAQQAWLIAATDYRRFHLARHIGLVEPTLFSRLNRLDYQISGHPIQPGFLDTFGAYKYSGLVHDIGFPITQESLSHQHGLTDLSDVVLGYYAIEFMLFNQGTARNVDDFKAVASLDSALKERGFEKLEEVPRNRRRALLETQATLLLSDLQTLNTLWQGDSANAAHKEWRSLNVKKHIDIIHAATASALTQCMIEIGELNQNDEHEHQRLSPHIYAASFAQQQQFIHNALASIHSAVPMLINANQPNIEKALAHAVRLTEKTALAETETLTEHWRDVFTAVKDASDFLGTPPAQSPQ